MESENYFGFSAKNYFLGVSDLCFIFHQAAHSLMILKLLFISDFFTADF